MAGPRRSALKSSDKAKGLLGPPSNIPLFPGLQTALSNISGDSTGDQSEDAAFAAYAKYAEDADANSQSSHVSFESQDTFTTFGDGRSVNVWGKATKFPTLNCFSCSVAWAEHVVKSRSFKRVSIVLILLNCLLAAVATADFVTESRTTKNYFDLMKEIFVYIMSAELFLQFAANGINFFANGWLVFDMVIVGLGWIMPNLLVMRTFRVVRTLRLATWVKDLKQLVVALLLVIPKMFAIFFLLAILFLIFSILFTDLFKSTYDDGITTEDYFSRIDISLFTLFQIMTLDGWAEICKEIMEEYPWAWAPFVAFVVVSSFFFLNLVIAVVCDAVTSVHQQSVVKYIQDDISAATSVREALKVEDRLEELAGSMQLMMQAQITVLEGLQVQKQQISIGLPGSGDSASSRANEEKIIRTTQSLRDELNSTFFGSKVHQQPGDSTPVTQNTNRQQVELADKQSDLATQFPRKKFGFDSDRGPSTAGFWRDIGLTEDQIERVMSRLNDNAMREESQAPLSTLVANGVSDGNNVISPTGDPSDRTLQSRETDPPLPQLPPPT